MEKRVHFGGWWLPMLLVVPQLAVTFVFFVWPAAHAFWQSTLREDLFGGNSQFVGAEQYLALFRSSLYWDSVWRTLAFSGLVAGIGLVAALLLAVTADRITRGRGLYRTLLIVPYAVAPPIAGMLWSFLFNPSVGVVSAFLGANLGYRFNATGNGRDALILIVLAAVWNFISYNILFFLAGLQSIPKSLIEAAAIDGAGPVRRLWTIVLPLLSPTAFFLLVVNVIYAFFGTFGIINATTSGGPSHATEILVYKVYNDGFNAQDLGGSSAQSVLLMLVVSVLTIAQFRFVERRVHY